MTWNTKNDTNWDVLNRIVALLFALADLADLASDASHPVRCTVLDILRPAVAVALRCISGTANDLARPSSLPASMAVIGDEPADAMRLGLCLRALALALANLLARGGSSGAQGDTLSPGLDSCVSRQERTADRVKHGLDAPQAPDTS